jgi:hypothetical protein
MSERSSGVDAQQMERYRESPFNGFLVCGVQSGGELLPLAHHEDRTTSVATAASLITIQLGNLEADAL